ncbi:hypothetical protein BJ085DRAFT_40551 [Dimargaris cristalligena]|uniref:Uncharacterized protein n=1 Tax=Dimargaris cristalligena TaxID=215637 RepID=A0A4P9ZKR5_9FUNG|nr:hypothetical protein BJ085DRAFT_40551 [Dimargaris cristalligena]|eukprot:RKP33695.1 hypothetical protein BJ085DRAFT_40551 [Dimargaris cristalligena]
MPDFRKPNDETDQSGHSSPIHRLFSLFNLSGLLPRDKGPPQTSGPHYPTTPRLPSTSDSPPAHSDWGTTQAGTGAGMSDLDPFVTAFLPPEVQHIWYQLQEGTLPRLIESPFGPFGGFGDWESEASNRSDGSHPPLQGHPPSISVPHNPMAGGSKALRDIILRPQNSQTSPPSDQDPNQSALSSMTRTAEGEPGPSTLIWDTVLPSLFHQILDPAFSSSIDGPQPGQSHGQSRGGDNDPGSHFSLITQRTSTIQNPDGSIETTVTTSDPHNGGNSTTTTRTDASGNIIDEWTSPSAGSTPSSYSKSAVPRSAILKNIYRTRGDEQPTDMSTGGHPAALESPPSGYDVVRQTPITTLISQLLFGNDAPTDPFGRFKSIPPNTPSHPPPGPALVNGPSSSANDESAKDPGAPRHTASTRTTPSTSEGPIFSYMAVQSITHPDGSVEYKRTIRNPDGTEEVFTSQSAADSSTGHSEPYSLTRKDHGGILARLFGRW